MNIMFYILIMLIAAVVYFLLSFLFGSIGDVATRLAKTFKNNITDEKEKTTNE